MNNRLIAVRLALSDVHPVVRAIPAHTIQEFIAWRIRQRDFANRVWLHIPRIDRARIHGCQVTRSVFPNLVAVRIGVKALVGAVWVDDWRGSAVLNVSLALVAKPVHVVADKGDATAR